MGGACDVDGCAIDLTTSPLQMGHVLRRVVSQGVLHRISTYTRQYIMRLHLHALCVEFMPAWQAHDTTMSINVFFEAHDAFDLSAMIFLSLDRSV